MKDLGNPLFRIPNRPLPGRVVIIGAEMSALPDLDLVLVDVAQELLDRSLARTGARAKTAVAGGKMTETRAAAIARGVRGTTDHAAIRSRLGDRGSRPQEADRCAGRDPDRARGADHLQQRLIAGRQHFLRSQAQRPRYGGAFLRAGMANLVVEVVRAADADPQIVEYLRWLFCMTGKVPLTTADVECFILDRGFNNWCHEAAHCLERTSAAQIDHVAAQFVEPAPFFALSAGNGSSVISKANQILAAAKGEQYRPAAVAAPNAQSRPVQLDPSPQMTRPPRPSWSPQRTVEGTRHGRVDK